MNLKYTDKADRQLHSLSVHDQDLVLSMIEGIIEEPWEGERIRGSRTLFRWRKGDYRVVYRYSSSSRRTLGIIFIEYRSPHTYHRVNPPRRRLKSPDIVN